MGDTPNQKPDGIKKMTGAVFLLVGLISVGTFVFSIFQSEPSKVEVAQIDPADFLIPPEKGYEKLVQATEPMVINPERSIESSTCFVSDLNIPLVRHSHWPGNQPRIETDFYDGAFMHDLFYRANCP